MLLWWNVGNVVHPLNVNFVNIHLHRLGGQSCLFKKLKVAMTKHQALQLCWFELVSLLGVEEAPSFVKIQESKKDFRQDRLIEYTVLDTQCPLPSGKVQKIWKSL